MPLVRQAEGKPNNLWSDPFGRTGILEQIVEGAIIMVAVIIDMRKNPKKK